VHGPIARMCDVAGNGHHREKVRIIPLHRHARDRISIVARPELMEITQRAVIDAADAEDIGNPKHLIVDGTEDQAAALAGIAPGWDVHRHARPDGQWLGGNKWPYWYLLEIARANTAPGDEALCLEDDLEFATNAIQRMLLLRIPRDVHVMQFFSGFLFRDPKTPPGLWRSPAPVQGCQALKFGRATLDKLCEWKRNPEWQKFNESDVALGLAQQRLALRFANHLPDIVQHVGDVSAVSHGMMAEAGITDGASVDVANQSLAERTSRTYVGPDFDCLRLFARSDLYL